MLPLLDVVGWAVPPRQKANTRPAKLVRNLSDEGVIASSSKFYFHGKAQSEGNAWNAGRVMPRIPPEASSSGIALFSPIFHPSLQGGRVKWIDLYDDWRLAPDINLLHRLLSKLSYDALRSDRANILVTCNSPYMAGKLNLSAASVVPNGVDPHLANLPRSGDDQERLIVLGHFFRGRTDYDLIARIAREGVFKEILFGAPGSGKKISSVIQECRKHATVTVSNWIDDSTLASLVGSRTAALVPHVVNDYTLSQDLMKIYQYLALGIKVICPIELWPCHLSKKNGFLLGVGSNLTPNLSEWLSATQISDVERYRFAQANSWHARAQEIRLKLEAIHAN